MLYRKELEALYEAFRTHGIHCSWDEDMSRHTTFRIGGRAALAVWPAGRGQLILTLSLWRELGRQCPLCVLGRGSNVLISDRGFDGLMVLTSRTKRVVFEEDDVPDREKFRREHSHCQVYAECGVSLVQLSNICAEEDRELSGLEFACGIPGSVGGAIVMNAGAYGSDVERVLLSADYYDLSSGEVGQLRDSEMQLDYRHSIFMEHPDWIVLSGVFSLSYGNGEAIRSQIRENRRSRSEKQPKEPSAGSVFKRPVGNYAASLIDRAGLKEARVGGAVVSGKHAGFIVNMGGATAEDVRALVRFVRDRVEELYRYRLECEIRYICDGTDGDTGW
jgi:UDP-N-acetylmuramate dehydrogenase